MILPDITGTVVRNANPLGCQAYLNQQWQKLLARPAGKSYRSILVLGCSSGFGLATRLVGLRNGARYSVGVCFERAPDETHTGSAGWHLDQHFHRLAAGTQHQSITLNRDAFLAQTKAEVVEQIRQMGQTFDLVVYSLAAGVKVTANGEKIRSSILPRGRELRGLQADFRTDSFSEMVLNPANDQQLQHTVDIMGGSDWQQWLTALQQAGVLSEGCETYNYSYLGSDLNADIYRTGTLGAAKDHMHQTAEQLRKDGINARAVVCKALVTKASLFIPLMAPYLMALKAELAERGHDEDVFDQMRRLFAGETERDRDLLRLDNHELHEPVQRGICRRLQNITADHFHDHLDFRGIRSELLRMHGFV